MTRRPDQIAPRGLREADAAAYVGMPLADFRRRTLEDPDFPKAKIVSDYKRRPYRIYDRVELDAIFDGRRRGKGRSDGDLLDERLGLR